MQLRHNMPEQGIKALEGFVNRESEIRNVKDFLKPNSRTWLAAVYGIGGIGKTTFALKVASTVANEKLFDVVVWSTAKSERFDPRKAKVVNASSGFPPFRRKPLESLDQLLRDILKLFEVSNKRRWSVDDRLEQVYDLLKSRRTLIIVDDFEMLGEGASEDIAEFVGRTLPEPTKAIVTSRRALDIPGEASLKLFGLPLKETKTLVETRAKMWNIRAGENIGEKDIERLHKFSGGNPLAIELIVGQLKKVPLQAIFESATKIGDGFDAYEGFENFLFETAFSESDKDSQRLWLTLAAIGEPRSENELSQLTHLPLYSIRESTDWLDSNGLVSKHSGQIRLHPVAVSFGRRVLETSDTLPRDIEKQLEDIYTQSR